MFLDLQDHKFNTQSDEISSILYDTYPRSVFVIVSA